MANNLKRNPMIVDTAFSTAETTEHAQRPCKITGIAWTGTPGSLIAASSDLIIKDGEGHIIFRKRAQAAGDDAYIHFPQTFNTKGIDVDTIDAGIVFIYQ
jgi:hypothetical protein